MSYYFHLLDLPSQALAVQRLLKGCTVEEKLAWLAEHGELSRIPIAIPNARPIYSFVSSIGMECGFFIDGDEFVFIGDHTTYTAREQESDWG
jgi:hypothetical protein